MTAAPAGTVEVAGRPVRLPVGVRDAHAASAAFVVPAAALRSWLPDGLSVVPAGRERALVTLSVIRYLDGDLGRYDELSIAAVVRHGARVGSYIHRLPVDDEFSLAAGRTIWGFPKTLEVLAVHAEDERLACAWRSDGRRVLRLAIRNAGRGVLPAAAYRAFTVFGGRLHATRFMMRATGFGARRGGAVLRLGHGQAADELRDLGLPKRALFSSSMERMQARFDAPRPL